MNCKVPGGGVFCCGISLPGASIGSTSACLKLDGKCPSVAVCAGQTPDPCFSPWNRPPSTSSFLYSASSGSRSRLPQRRCGSCPTSFTPSEKRAAPSEARTRAARSLDASEASVGCVLPGWVATWPLTSSVEFCATPPYSRWSAWPSRPWVGRVGVEGCRRRLTGPFVSPAHDLQAARIGASE